MEWVIWNPLVWCWGDGGGALKEGSRHKIFGGGAACFSNATEGWSWEESYFDHSTSH